MSLAATATDRRVSHPRRLGRGFVCAGVLAALFLGMAASPATGSSPPKPSPVVEEADREFSTMTATRYQHRNREDVAAGTYFYDCVGFVTYALGRAAPAARSTIMHAIRRGFVPSPARYVRLFDELDGTQTGWTPVRLVRDLHPGDIVAWTYEHPASSNGHAFVVASPPQPDGRRSALVRVWDSTATPHGPHDTRRTDPKNLPGPNGKPSGLGSGTVRIDTNIDGTLATVHWSPTSSAVPAARFGIGRPTS
jgi:hypothetical protein